MKVILKHVSHLKGSEGNPGDEVEVDDERGAAWIADGSAEVASTKAKRKPRKKSDESEGLSKESVRTKADSSSDG